MESITRRSVLSSAAGVAAVGLTGQLFAEEPDKSRGAATGQDCLCTIQIPDLNTAELSARGEAESRDLISALVGALVPVIVDEIVKATRSRSGVSASARGVDLQQLTAAREGERGADEQAMRGLFSGSFSGPGIKIGVVVG